MNTKKLAATVVTLASAAAAVHAGLDLAHHGVNLPLTIAAASAIFTTALTFVRSILTAANTRAYRCPTPGCDVEIRTTGTTTAEQQKWEALATDHTRHAAT